MKNIVCLDGKTMDLEDSDWDSLRQLGHFTYYDRSIESVEQVIERAKDAHILLTNKTPITRQVIDACPNLEYITVSATGYNVVDHQYAKTKGIPVSNVPAYGTDTVAEMVFALVFRLTRSVERYSQDVRENLGWTNSIDWTYSLCSLTELSGKTIGLVGFGAIGQRVGAIARAFKMRVLVYSRSQPSDVGFDYEFVSLDELLRQADIVSMHCPAVADTENMINKEKLSLMKKSAFFINTARGQLVVEQDLAEALNQECIAGAALDTLQQEPPKADNPLLSAKNCVITPHNAWATLDARLRIMECIVGNIRSYLQQEPKNIINA